MSWMPFIRKYAIIQIVFILFVITAAFFIPTFFPTEYSLGEVKKEAATITATVATIVDAPKLEPAFVVTHVPTPKPLRAIYMSQCVVGTKPFRDDLVKVIDDTEINAVVIDIKDYSGRVAFPTENPVVKPATNGPCGAYDMKEFIGFLHEKNIYVIGRITVFQDPFMTKAYPERAVHKLSDGGVWKDYKGLSFIDVGSKEHWNYIVELSKESYAVGFDELNYDYIRYPSDGNMKDTSYQMPEGSTKREMLRQFFVYLHDQVKPTGVITSADIFGMTTTNTDDLNIGQVLENALVNFDYVAPMVYPSHYPPNFHGWADPNKHPYELIKYVMSSGAARAKALDAALASSTPSYDGNSAEKLRPWLQDFQYGGTYGPAEIRAQIQATYDSGLDSWMMWSPSNRYTTGALDKAQ